MNDELFDSLQLLEKEKGIKAEVLMDAIKSSLTIACEKNFKRQGLTNVSVRMDPVKRTLGVYLDKTVVEDVEDPLTQISLGDAQMRNGKYQLGDIVPEEVNSRGFNRIAVKSAKDVIMQQVREAERMSLYADYFDKENKVITGKVQRYVGRNVIINLGKVDAMLTESEMIHGETFYPNERVKVYIVRVENGTKGPRIVLSRKSPNFVRALFEEEVAEVADGTVEIKAIAREAGSRSKMAVWSNVDNVDAVGACVGQNGSRVAAVVDELGGEKIDIVAWDENPAYFIENALSPAKVVTVLVDEDERSAKVVVPDYQLSLAIGKEGQNARLTARLTGFKIDIKSETQAIESGELEEFQNEYYDDENGDYAAEEDDGSYGEDSDDLYNDEASADAAALYNDAMYCDSEAADDRSFGQDMPDEDEMPDEDGDGGLSNGEAE